MKRIGLILVYILTASLGTRQANPQARTQVIVIANPSVRASAASKGDIREVFTGGASTLTGGSRVSPVLLRSGAATDEFLASYLDEPDSAFRTRWRTLVFSGQATMPRSLDSEASVVEYVAHNAGAIGYISRSTPHEGVKVLAAR